MIKFFRKTRQKLLTENKLSKYLIYVSGEIVLVVIGILIALSINSWNENRKLQNSKTEYYKQLLKGLDLDIKEIDPKLKRTKQGISTVDPYLVNYEIPNLPLGPIYQHLNKLDQFLTLQDFIQIPSKC